MEKEQSPEEFCRYMWKAYFEVRRYDIIGDIMAEDVSVIGTGAHEISRNLKEFGEAMVRESKEWDGHFMIKDQWYQTNELTDELSLVMGEIVVREDAEDGILYDIRFRFSVLLKKNKNGYLILHIHQSVPDANQASDEFFPHNIVEKNERQVIYNLRHDTMTGLLNRLYIKETVNRFTAETSAGMLVMLDIDKFKLMNDNFGHPFGDKVLITLSQSLMASFQGKVVGRVGGDEFVIYLPDIQTRQEFEPLLLAFQKDWRERQRAFKLAKEITVSMGAAFCPFNGTTYQSLWKSADKALYEAKTSGAGLVCCQKRTDSDGAGQEKGSVCGCDK